MGKMKGLVLSAENFEDLELFVPYYRFLEEGIQVEIASLEKGEFTGKHGYRAKADKRLDQVRPEDYRFLLLPGGRAPQALRKEEKALEIARHFFEKGKPVFAICHGPQILVSAGLLKGRRVTCYRSVAPEVRKAGAIYEDKEVVVDGKLVTSRVPEDLPAFLKEIFKILKKETGK